MKTTSILHFSVVVAFSLTMSPVFAAGLGDEWNSVKALLYSGEKAESTPEALSHLNDARSTYETSFKDAALEVDPESDSIINSAFSDIEENLSEGDTGMASLNRQIVDKTIYKIAYMKMELAVEQDNADDFVSWYAVLEKKFKVADGDYKSHMWIAEIKSDASTLSNNGPEILAEMLDIFKIKTFEEIEEAIFAYNDNDEKSAKKFAYEGLYYYRTFHPAVEAELGTDSANELYDQMALAIDVSMSGDSIEDKKAQMIEIGAAVELLIRQYEGGDTSEVGLALSGMKDRLKLVDIEYADAVEDGVIVNQVEYDETVAFLTTATELFESVESELMVLSESDTSAIKANLAEIDTIVSSIGNPSKVTVSSAKSINNIATLQEYTDAAVEVDIFEYFDEIERLLGEARTEYRNGNTELAFDLVSEAYLDNYEFVEGPLGEVDRELMLKIEIDMREDLRNMIKNNESPDAVDAQIDMILVDLAAAEKVVPEFGTIALMILAVSIIAIIALSSKSRLNLMPKL